MSYFVSLENVSSDFDTLPVALVLSSADAAADVVASVCYSLAADLECIPQDPYSTRGLEHELRAIADAVSQGLVELPVIDHTVRLDEVGLWSGSLDGPCPRLRVYRTNRDY